MSFSLLIASFWVRFLLCTKKRGSDKSKFMNLCCLWHDRDGCFFLVQSSFMICELFSFPSKTEHKTEWSVNRAVYRTCRERLLVTYIQLIYNDIDSVSNFASCLQKCEKKAVCIVGKTTAFTCRNGFLDEMAEYRPEKKLVKHACKQEKDLPLRFTLRFGPDTRKTANK